jgi:O-phosphoseryl-tRNA synthetase
MKFDTKKIKAEAKKNFEKVWLETASLLPEAEGDYTKGTGRAHPLHELIGEVRKTLMNLGFDEVENSVFVPEEEVYWQYGPEAPVILDRCYYLAGLPRPDIGLSKEKIAGIMKINQGVEIERFQEILREYREGNIEGDDLFEEMVNRLGINQEEAAGIINLFLEFRALTPVPEKMTLRSHMTATWFPSLKALQYKEELPIKLFSIGMRFRREQKVDATHLRAHYGASCVVMDPEVGLDSGRKLSQKILNRLNFKEVSFIEKKATSNYYAPKTEFEIYSKEIEVADCGMYSPVALSNYGIEYPVFNIGFGLERILMLRMNQGDVREVLYPQFHKALKLSDREIMDQIRIDKLPRTGEGRDLALLISRVARENAEKKSPCRFLVYEGKFLGKALKVFVLEKEEGTTLLGPAALNEIYVYRGGVYGMPSEPEKLRQGLLEVKDKGVSAGFTFLDSIANYFAFRIEDFVGGDDKRGFFQVKMAKTPADVNVMIAESARRYITSGNKVISLKGPVFASVELLVD